MRHWCCFLPAVLPDLQLHGDISLFLSHDWPNEITRYGDKARLFRKKPYFQNEVSEMQRVLARVGTHASAKACQHNRGQIVPA